MIQADQFHSPLFRIGFIFSFPIDMEAFAALVLDAVADAMGQLAVGIAMVAALGDGYDVVLGS